MSGKLWCLLSPAPQFVPVMPGTHRQVYWFTPSTHVPQFRHGLGSHSSISKQKNMRGEKITSLLDDSFLFSFEGCKCTFQYTSSGVARIFQRGEGGGGGAKRGRNATERGRMSVGKLLIIRVSDDILF